MQRLGVLDFGADSLSPVRAGPRAAIGWKVIRRRRLKSLQFVHPGPPLAQFAIDLRRDDPSPCRKVVPPVGEARFVVEQRILFRADAAAEMKHTCADLICPEANRIKDQRHRRELEKFVSRPA